MLIQYVKHNGEYVGTVVALDKDQIGWSQCCPRDKFNKNRGVTIAAGRALVGTKKTPANTTGLAIHRTIVKMSERAEKYFKQKED